MREIFAELKRRNVLRAGMLYVGAVWALAQGVAQLGPVFDAPDWATRWFVIAAAIGFPFFLAFAWFYEFTPEGLKRESEIAPGGSIAAHTSKKLDRAIIGVLTVAIVLLLANTLVWRQGAGFASAQASGIPDMATDPSIAVLPFENLSSDKNQQFFSDGISEELLNLLSEVPKLRVIARTSSFSFRGKEVPIADIARKLHVAAVLEGSVRKAGNQVRITVQLIRASDSSQLWSQNYDRTLTDIFKVQDDIAATVVDRLKVSLLGGGAPTVQPIDPRAYTLILQANALYARGSAANLAEAAALYKQALAIAPDAAPAWSGLGLTYLIQTTQGTYPLAVGSRLTKAALNKALAVDPRSGLTWSRLGVAISTLDNDQAESARLVQKGLALSPNDTRVVTNASAVLLNLDRAPEAVTLLQYAVSRDPANPRAQVALAGAQYQARQWAASSRTFRTALALNPAFPNARAGIATNIVFGKGNLADALKEMQAEPDEVSRETTMPVILDAMGRKADADDALATLIAQHKNDQALSIASTYAQRHDADQAFAWIDKAVVNQDPALSIFYTDPLFDPLHDDPRWLPLLRKLGTAPEQLAKIPFTVTLPDGTSASAPTQP